MYITLLIWKFWLNVCFEQMIFVHFSIISWGKITFLMNWFSNCLFGVLFIFHPSWDLNWHILNSLYDVYVYVSLDTETLVFVFTHHQAHGVSISFRSCKVQPAHPGCGLSVTPRLELQVRKQMCQAGERTLEVMLEDLTWLRGAWPSLPEWASSLTWNDWYRSLDVSRGHGRTSPLITSL